MNFIKQDATNEVSIECDLDFDEVTALVLTISQDGQEILRRELADCTVTENVLSFTLQSWEAEHFSPARFTLVMKATTEDGTFLSESVEGCVARR